MFDYEDFFGNPYRQARSAPKRNSNPFFPSGHEEYFMNPWEQQAYRQRQLEQQKKIAEQKRMEERRRQQLEQQRLKQLREQALAQQRLEELKRKKQLEEQEAMEESENEEDEEQEAMEETDTEREVFQTAGKKSNEVEEKAAIIFQKIWRGKQIRKFRLVSSLRKLNQVKLKVSDLELKYSSIVSLLNAENYELQISQIPNSNVKSTFQCLLGFEEELTKQLLSLDGILSGGSDLIRDARKQIVLSINNTLKSVDPIKSHFKLRLEQIANASQLMKQPTSASSSKKQEIQPTKQNLEINSKRGKSVDDLETSEDFMSKKKMKEKLKALQKVLKEKNEYISTLEREVESLKRNSKM